MHIQGDMDAAQPQKSAYAASPSFGGKPKVNVMDLLRIALRSWYWFVLTLAVCLAVAWVKLNSTAPVYTRTASVLIKGGNGSGRISTESQMFQEMGLMSATVSIDNEMLIFKSERLSQEVVKRLNLQTSYLYKEGLRTLDLYTKSPLRVRFADEDVRPGSFRITILSDKEVELFGFAGRESVRLRGKTGTLLNTPMGKVEVFPTLFYQNSWKGKTLEVVQQDTARLARSYSNRIVAAAAQKGAAVVNLTLQDVSAERAEDFLNTLVVVYNEDVIQDKNKMLQNSDAFIKERLAILENDLGGVEGEIASFKQRNKMVAVEAEAEAASSGAAQYQQESFKLENQIQLVRMIRDYLVDPAHATELIPSNTGVGDVNIEGQISTYNALLLERDKIRQSSGDENPAVQEMNRTLEVTRQAMVRTVDNALASLRIRLQQAEAQERSMAQRMTQVPEHEKYMLSVERQQKVKEQLYIYLLQKREENALAQSITESNARVVEPAKGPYGPISPVGSTYYLIAVAVGLGLPALVLFLSFVLNTKIRNRKDIEDNLTVPFLGDIPFHKWPKGKMREETVVRADGKDAVTEAFRMLRTNIGYMQVGGKENKVIMMTSMNPDSGKTFVVSNLALMMAYAGKKVLLIDLDIRKGALSRLFEGKKQPGITHYLSGKITREELIHRLPQSENLDIIFSGVVPPNPAEMLLSEELDALVHDLREQYDYILIDNVPSGVVADAAIVNRMADMTIYVLRAGLLDVRQLPDVERIYQEHRLKNMAVVLNGVKEEHAGYGYYGYYGYGYSYGYGYDNEKKKKKKKRKLF